MKIGLMGFGKTGKAVASVILQNQEFTLEWMLRRSHLLGHRSVPEFLGVESQAEMDLLTKLSQKTTVFWSPNITLDVNYLLFAAKFLKKIAPWADIEIIEEHFKQKEGISGTALKIAEALNIPLADGSVNS